MAKTPRLLYAMNNPLEPLEWEVKFLISMGFDGFELTLEPPMSYLEETEIHRDLIQSFVKIGHTRCDLEFASESSKDREFALEAMRDSLDKFQTFGVTEANYHPHRGSKSLNQEQIFKYNVDSLNHLIPYAAERGIRLMIENQPPYPNAADLRKLRDALDHPFYLLLDLAHAFCYCGDGGTVELIETFGESIAHVHISDNMGSDDDHLFPNYGKVDFLKYFKLLNLHMKENVNYSIESFRITRGNELDIVTRDERATYISEAVAYLKNLIQIAAS